VTQPVQRLLTATRNIWRFGRVESFCILYQLQYPSSSSSKEGVALFEHVSHHGIRSGLWTAL